MEMPSAEETTEFDAAEGKIDDGLYTQPGIDKKIEGVEEPSTPVDRAIGAELPKRSPQQRDLSMSNQHEANFDDGYDTNGDTCLTKSGGP